MTVIHQMSSQHYYAIAVTVIYPMSHQLLGYISDSHPFNVTSALLGCISDSDPPNVTSALFRYINDSDPSNVTSALLFHINYRPCSFLNPLAMLPYFDASHQFQYLSIVCDAARLHTMTSLMCSSGIEVNPARN